MEDDTIHVDDEVLQYAAFLSARSKFWTTQYDKLLRKWQKQIDLRRKGHKEEERKYKTIYMTLGIPSAILGGVISAAVFGTFKNCDCTEVCYTDEVVRIISGIIALLSAILASVISFVDAGGTREKHKSSADTYDQLSHQIETLLRTDKLLRGDPNNVIQEIRTNFDNATKESPTIPNIYETQLTTYTTPSVKRKEKSEEEIIEIPTKEYKYEKGKRVEFDQSIIKSLSFEMRRLNSDDENREEDDD